MPVRVDLKRLEKSIIEFESVPIQKGRILFYGSSGFTRWKPKYGNPRLESVVVGPSGQECTLNHGFGSSTAEELLYFYPRAVRPFEPRALVYRIFGNDISFGYSPREIMEISERVFAYARADIPGIRFYLVGPEGNPKPSPDRNANLIRKREYDNLLRYYASQHDDCTYITIRESPEFFHDPADVGDFDKVREDLFIEDKVHFNAQGYELLADFYKKALADVLI